MTEKKSAADDLAGENILDSDIPEDQMTPDYPPAEDVPAGDPDSTDA